MNTTAVSKTHSPKRLVSLIVLSILVAFGLLIAIFPFHPFIPRATLDDSWAYALNEAVSRHLAIGREIIFPFGPYASVYSLSYHPATAGLMIAGSLLLASSIFVGTITLSQRRGVWLLALAPFIFMLSQSRDALCFSIPVIFFLIAAAQSRQIEGSHPTHALLPRISLGIATVGMSLLPLVKVSSSISVALGLCLGTIVIARTSLLFAIGTILLFTVSTCCLWLIAGQSLTGLAPYFVAQLPLLTGYTEAMSLPERSSDILIYASGTLLLLILFLVAQGKKPSLASLLLCVCATGTLFLGFKAGFVRNHGLTAAATMLIVSYLLSFEAPFHIAAIMLLTGLACSFGISARYSSPISIFTTRVISRIASFPGNLVALPGYADRNNLRFSQAVASIQADNPLPEAPGTADIYSHNQATLLSRGVDWSPRPVFQSYTAYTPQLAQINADHLFGPRSPESILFKIQPIDKRLPSLEDGLSWPALLSLYTVQDRAHDYLLLRSNRARPASTARENNLRLFGETVYRGNGSLGKRLYIPDSSYPLWAEIDLHKTLVGRVLSTFYKPQEVHIRITLRSGRRLTYRYISSMGRSGFLLSPLITNTWDFLLLTSTQWKEALALQRPVSIEFFVPNKRNFTWDRNFSVHLREIALPQQPVADPLTFTSQLLRALPNDLHGLPTIKGGVFAIDQLNGRKPVSESVLMSKVLYMQGWAAISARDGIAPGGMFLMLTDLSGRSFYLKPELVARPDVNLRFRQPKMGKVGFFMRAHLGALQGDFRLKLLLLHNSTIYSCDLDKTVVLP